MLHSNATRNTRREFLAAGASLVGLGLVPGGACAAPGTQAQRPSSDADELDEGYARIAARFPDANFHASNHAPMVAEVLFVLGRAERIEPWLDENLDDHVPGKPASEPIDPARWRAALGRNERFADWQAYFRNAFEEADWRTVLGTWVPRLAPGLAGAATHGLIRSGHAARALAARENPIRKVELATGLAYWAASYVELPWDGTLALESSVSAAFAKVAPRRPELAPPEGNIVTGLRALQETPSFRSVAGFVDPSEPERLLSESASVFARAYLRNPDRRIAFVHSITAPSALRLLAPYLDAESLRLGVRYAWQAAAGLYAVYGDPSGSAPAESEPATVESIVARAVETGGTHTLKLTEACLREHALSRDAALLLAADDAIRDARM